jgi:hypothetical protein
MGMTPAWARQDVGAGRFIICAARRRRVDLRLRMPGRLVPDYRHPGTPQRQAVKSSQSVERAPEKQSCPVGVAAGKGRIDSEWDQKVGYAPRGISLIWASSCDGCDRDNQWGVERYGATGVRGGVLPASRHSTARSGENCAARGASARKAVMSGRHRRRLGPWRLGVGSEGGICPAGHILHLSP